MHKGIIMVIGCLLSVILGSATGYFLLFLNFGTTLISGIASIIGFLGYMVTDLICFRLSKDKNITE